MGDISTDTSMEDILSSIKRIIAEEGDGTRAPRKTDASGDGEPGEARDPADAVLELREAVAEAIADPQRAAAVPEEDAGATAVEDRAAETTQTGDADSDAMLSRRATEASRGSLEALSRMIVKPDTAGSDTLEGMVREMLRPMLSEWLDANLPEIVERMVAREITRITERDL